MPISFPDSEMQVTAFLAQIDALIRVNNPFRHFAALILLFGLIVAGCSGLNESDRESIEQALQDVDTNYSESWNIRMELMDDGHRFLTITSPYARTVDSREGSTTTLDGPVYIEVRNEDGEPETIVNADKAIYHSRISEFEMEGNVRVSSIGEKRLYTETLKWYQNVREIATPDFVIIVTPRDSISGYGLHGDDRLETYVIERVSGVITIDTDSQEGDS